MRFRNKRVLRETGPMTQDSERERGGGGERGEREKERLGRGREGREMSEGARRITKAGATNRPPRGCWSMIAKRGRESSVHGCIQLYGCQICATLCKWYTRATRPAWWIWSREVCVWIRRSPKNLRSKERRRAAPRLTACRRRSRSVGYAAAGHDVRPWRDRRIGRERTKRLTRDCSGWRVQGDVIVAGGVWLFDSSRSVPSASIVLFLREKRGGNFPWERNFAEEWRTAFELHEILLEMLNSFAWPRGIDIAAVSSCTTIFRTRDRRLQSRQSD